MNHERIPLDEDRALPDALRWQLRAQRRDVPPAADLWPGIAARLAPRPQRRTRRTLPFALAASVMVATFAGALALRTPSWTPEQRAATQLSQDYRAALETLPQPQAPADYRAALSELDRSARDIRRALQRDPDSRLLLEQLRRTYTLRLVLTQRAVVG